MDDIHDPNLKLELWSRAGDVVIVRQALGGISELLALDAAQAADIATAVSEACNNVVVHAYAADDGGPMNVEVALTRTTVVVTVWDLGTGVAPDAGAPVHADGPGGLGIPLMVSLADSVEFSDRTRRGTAVRLTFAVGHVDRDLVLSGPTWTERPAIAADHIARGGALMTASPARLAAASLSRVARVLAGRARFTAGGLEDVDRLARQIADEVAAEGPGRALTCAIVVGERELELCTYARLTAIERAEPEISIQNESDLTRALVAAR